MNTRLYRRPPPAIPLIDWSCEAQDSVKFLLGMYVKETRPFSEWRDADAELRPEIEELASTNVKAYQLWLWFALYRQRRGVIEGRLLRGAFFHLFNKPAPDGTDRERGRPSIQIQNHALEYLYDFHSAERDTRGRERR